MALKGGCEKGGRSPEEGGKEGECVTVERLEGRGKERNTPTLGRVWVVSRRTTKKNEKLGHDKAEYVTEITVSDCGRETRITRRHQE